MNFEKLAPVDRGKQLLDIAFRKAREKGSEKKLTGNHLQIIRKKESLKIDIVKDILVSRLNKVIKDFPETEKLPVFYQALIKLTLDYALFKKSFGALGWAEDKIRFFQKIYVRKINQETNVPRIKMAISEFYGRVASVMKQIDPQLDFLEHSRRIMKTYPDIKDMFTVCVYGFPNVGKTTLLNKITGTKAEVAAYAFTTKTINAGYFVLNGEKIQVLDVPGILGRDEKRNIIELQAELVLKELANVIIFVFDVSEYCGFSLKKQEQLFKKLGKGKKILIYVSKLDLIEDVEEFDFKHRYYSVEELKEEILKAKAKYDKEKYDKEKVKVEEVKEVKEVER